MKPSYPVSINNTIPEIQPRHDTDSFPITLIICSNRIHLIEQYWQYNHSALTHEDRLLIVLDLPQTPQAIELAAILGMSGINCIINRGNFGLAYSRNIAMVYCETNHLIFIDDDVVIPSTALFAIRTEFSRGIDVVGVKICGPQQPLQMPWYLSDGQLHYLSIHNDHTNVTWGACMAINVRLVRQHGLLFRKDLGRHGTSLESGDDTTFIQELRNCGANESFLRHAYVYHNIEQHRLRLWYLLRRAYWQGRSEYRRQNALKGIQKECRRNWMSRTTFKRRLVLSSIYITCVLIGVIREVVELSSIRLLRKILSRT